MGDHGQPLAQPPNIKDWDDLRFLDAENECVASGSRVNCPTDNVLIASVLRDYGYIPAFKLDAILPLDQSRKGLLPSFV